MKLIFYIYTCGTCGNIFKVPDMPPYAYGEFILRKKNDSQIRYLNAVEDPPYSEVKAFLKENPQFAEADSGTILSAIFGPVACDPDVDGIPFELNLDPYCEHCGPTHSVWWEITEPPEFIDIEVPTVQHEIWSSLNPQEREEKALRYFKNIFAKN